MTEKIPVESEKQAIREKVWKRLDEQNLVSFPKPCYGRIPNFIGSEMACERLLELGEFQIARCVFFAPDYVLKRGRELTLECNKILAVATPHMRRFLEISGVPKNEIGKATNIKGFEKYGKILATKVDLFVQGSVAVDTKGNRLGKGRGYGDKEYWYLKHADLLSHSAKIVTVVHESQIFDDFSAVMSPGDVPVDYILTNNRIIKITHLCLQ
jgi:5-formyltetrahydrofolate cyclo-ligase